MTIKDDIVSYPCEQYKFADKWVLLEENKVVNLETK